MKERRMDPDKLRGVLMAGCPNIAFAMFNGINRNGVPGTGMSFELAVYLSPDPGMFAALELILPLVEENSPSGVFCELTLLNRVNALSTMEIAETGNCLFIRPGYETVYNDFLVQSKLNSRIIRAHLRRRGMSVVPEPWVLPASRIS
jgi:hypothetical protein